MGKRRSRGSSIQDYGLRKQLPLDIGSKTLPNAVRDTWIRFCSLLTSEQKTSRWHVLWSLEACTIGVCVRVYHKRDYVYLMPPGPQLPQQVQADTVQPSKPSSIAASSTTESDASGNWNMACWARLIEVLGMPENFPILQRI